MAGPEEKLVFSNLTVYRTRGAYLKRLEQFQKAIDAYNEAYKTNPEDVRLLLRRSIACADGQWPQQAYEDAEAALRQDRHSVVARNVQARALNAMCEFERALVVNYRGARKRIQPRYFLEGIDTGTAILQECIGADSGNALLKFLPILKKHDHPPVNVDDEHHKPPHVSRIPVIKQKPKVNQEQARKTRILNRVMAMKYLGPMAQDKFFLKDLKKSSSVDSANKESSEELKKLIRYAYQKISETQEVLRTQRPYYVIKEAEKTESTRKTKFQQETLRNEMLISAQYAEKCLRVIRQNMIERDVQQLMYNAERMQSFLDKKTKRTLPDKEEYTDRLYRYVGQGYLSMYRLSNYLSESSNRRRVAFLMGMPVGRTQSYDSVITRSPTKCLEIDKFEKGLSKCENSLMKFWLMYEISKVLALQKNYSLSKFYGRKLVDEANEIKERTWAMNGVCVLLCSEMKQNNVNEIRILVEEGLKMAMHPCVPYREHVADFLRKCEEMSLYAAVVDQRKITEQRENEILALADNVTREEGRMLFKRLKWMPDGRRFSVVPTPPVPMQMTPARTRRWQRNLTIVPGPTKGLPAPPKAHVKGFEVFEF